MKRYESAIVVFVILVLLGLILVTNVYQEKSNVKLEAMESETAYLLAKVQYNAEKIAKLEGKLSETNKTIRDIETWIDEHKEFVEMFTEGRE